MRKEEYANKIAELGELLESKYKTHSISAGHKQELMTRFDVSEKMFNILFSDYLKDKPKKTQIAKGYSSFFGVANGRSRPVQNTKTGERYVSIKVAAEAIGVNHKTLERNIREGTKKYAFIYSSN